MGLSGRVMTRTPRLRGWEHGHTVKHGRALPYVPQPVATSVGACCLMGFWGVPNFGDEWLFRAGQSFLREAFPGCRLSALVGSARVERRLGRHADGLALLDGFFPDPAFFRKLPAIVQAIRTADLTLIGGGGLINDTYTSFSIPRYTVPALLATALGTPVVWWGLGVVPPKRRVLRSLAMWTLRHAAAVLIRDPGQPSLPAGRTALPRRRARICPCWVRPHAARPSRSGRQWRALARGELPRRSARSRRRTARILGSPARPVRPGRDGRGRAVRRARVRAICSTS